MNLFFDLDGTLLDAWLRQYELFSFLTAPSTMPFEQYRSLKRGRTSHPQILSERFGWLEADVARFQERWLASIEHASWLERDRPFPGVTEYLAARAQEADLYVVTARRQPAEAIRQIHGFGWKDLFTGVLVTEGRSTKAELMRRVPSLARTDWIIGDTEEDVAAGKALGMRTAAVLSGHRTREILERCGPDVVVESVLAFDGRG